MTENNDQKKVRDLLEDMRFAMFTTVAEDGTLESRPMTVQKIDDDFRLLFIAQRNNTVTKGADGKQVNLAFCKDNDYVSVSGKGSILDDVKLKKELWNPMNDAYTEGGAENPDNIIIAVEADKAEYWDSPAAPVTLVSIAKALVTGSKPQAGEHGEVDL